MWDACPSRVVCTFIGYKVCFVLFTHSRLDVKLGCCVVHNRSLWCKTKGCVCCKTRWLWCKTRLLGGKTRCWEVELLSCMPDMAQWACDKARVVHSATGVHARCCWISIILFHQFCVLSVIYNIFIQCLHSRTINTHYQREFPSQIYGHIWRMYTVLANPVCVHTMLGWKLLRTF